MFNAFNLKPSSKNKGLMSVELTWPGSPLEFDPDKMKGTAGLEIFDGSIVEFDIKSKKFRALGIFNLGVITDVLTLKIFKKIGNKINDAISGGDTGVKGSVKSSRKKDDKNKKSDSEPIVAN